MNVKRQARSPHDHAERVVPNRLSKLRRTEPESTGGSGQNKATRSAVRRLSTPFHKYDHVCGEGFSAQTRRERRAYPFPTRRDKARATTSGPKRTAARRAASLFGSGVVAPRSSRQVGTGDAPSSRLARTEKRRNKCGRIYEMEY